MPGDSVVLSDPLMNKAAVAAAIGVCVRTLERYILDGQFPPPLRFAPKSRPRWRRSTVERFLREREEAARRAAKGG